MRIALVTSSFAPYVGGVEEHVRNVAKQLQQRGHHVVVWTIARDGRFGRRRHEGVEVWDLPAPLPARSPRAIGRFLLRVPAAAAHWLRAARAARPSVIHVQCFGPNGTYGALLARLLRIPLIVSSHGETMADDHGVFDASALARRSLRSALAHAAAVTGCSQTVLDDLETRFGLDPRRGVRVPNGVDLDEQVTPPSAGSPAGFPAGYIAAVGRLQRAKGFDLLVEAFAAADLAPGAHLVIGGDGPERETIAAIAERLGVGDRVHLPGTLTRSAVAHLLSNAAVVAVPSRFEAFGITVLEAWRAGRPLVVTNRGGPPEFVRDGIDGLVRDPEDARAFGAALRELLDDPARAAGIGRAGRGAVADLTWAHTADRYESLYAGHASGRTRPRTTPTTDGEPPSVSCGRAIV